MTQLSVNINKVALIRNSREGNYPNIIQISKDLEKFGAQGITVHPRPDERHIRYQDCYDLKEIVQTELNIEGYPSRRFIDMILEVKPHQVTLVPDAPDALTSDAGWDTVKNKSFLTEVISELKTSGARVSVFVDPIEQLVEGAKEIQSDRIEFYTGPYAVLHPNNPDKAIEKYSKVAKFATQIGIGINAGHDLNLDNLRYFKDHVENLLEVSIGHALISDALYYGFEKTIQLYRERLTPKA